MGRAESWVEAKRLQDWAGELNCFPGAGVCDTETGELKTEPVHLFLPMPKSEYDDFQTNFLQGISARNLPKRELNQIHATLKANWLDMLRLDTAGLQAAGWSAPPAARKMLYQRPIQALQNKIACETSAIKFTNADTVTVRYAIYGKPLTRIEDTLKFAEWLRFAVLCKARSLLGKDNVPALLSGHGLSEGKCHQHAFFIPEADKNSRIAHAVIHIPEGFDMATRKVLENINKVWNRDGQEWRLIMEYMGEKAGFASAVPLLSQSREWKSATPYLHPWHCKKNFSVAEQIRREWRERGHVSEIIDIEPFQTIKTQDGKELSPIDFHRFRSKRGLVQPDKQGSFWRLRFSEPITGPLQLGFACHFGLGQFIPE